MRCHPGSDTYDNGRGGEIRTHDPHVPNVVLYQAELHPDLGAYSNQAGCALKAYKDG